MLRAGVAHHLRGLARATSRPAGIRSSSSWSSTAGRRTRSPGCSTQSRRARDVFGDLASTSAPLRRPRLFTTGRTARLRPPARARPDRGVLPLPRARGGARHLRRRAPGARDRGRGCASASLLAIRDDALAQLDRFKGRDPEPLRELPPARPSRPPCRARRDPRADRAVQRARAGRSPCRIEPELVEALLERSTTGPHRPRASAAEASCAAGHATRIEAPYLQLVLAAPLGGGARGGSTRDAARDARAPRRRERGRAKRTSSARSSELDRRRTRTSPRTSSAPGHAVRDEDRARAPRPRASTRTSTRTGSSRSSRGSSTSGSCVRSRSARTVRQEARTPRRIEIFHDVLGEAVLAWRGSYESDRRVALRARRVRPPASSRARDPRDRHSSHSAR